MPPPESSAPANVDASGPGLPRAARLRKRREFLAVRERGRSVSGPGLVMAVLENGRPHRRLGLTVSSRVGGAVVRNRIKRWLRHIYRQHRGALPPGVDVVLIARPGSPQLGHRRLTEVFLELAARLGAGEGRSARGRATGGPSRGPAR